jgi:thymidine kinase
LSNLQFHYSVMNAGKTTRLLQVRHNYAENGGHVLLFTSAIDDRAGVGKVASRMGLAADAVALRAGDDLMAIVSGEHAVRAVAAVLLDEVQFMTVEHVRQAARVADRLGIPVLAYGLKNNAFGELFGPSVHALLALADEIREIERLCHCGRKATMILRYDADGMAVRAGAVVEVGGDDRYVSVCRPHWDAGEIGARQRASLACREAA